MFALARRAPMSKRVCPFEGAMRDANQRLNTAAVVVEVYVSERLLRLKEVLNITGLSRSRLYALIKMQKFPMPIPIGEDSRTRGWIASQVDGWVTRQIERAAELQRIASQRAPIIPIRGHEQMSRAQAK
jgi:prophage regulatory protein